MLAIPRLVAVAATMTIAATGVALAQSGQHHMAPAKITQTTPHQSAVPTMPGQDAFGAIQEIVHMLDADPKTDWSKVDLEALRQHLIDMNEVTLRAAAAARQVEGGLEIAVTGSGRTLVAIQRMVPAWAHTMNGQHGWNTAASPLLNGELLRVTAADQKELRHIRGLGFIGLMVSGSQHQPHHFAMAKGEFDHGHMGRGADPHSRVFTSLRLRRR